MNDELRALRPLWIPGGILAAAALLILAVRITNFEWTPSNVKLQFAKSGNALMGAVATLLKKIGV